MLFSWCN